MLTKIRDISRRVNEWSAANISGSVMLVATFLMTADVIMRGLLGDPIRGVIEICETMMVWIIYAAVGHALITGNHVRVTLVLNRLSPRLRSKFEVFVNFVGFGFFAVLTCQAGWFFWNAWVLKTVPMALIGVPIFYAAVFMPIGCAFISIHFLIRLMCRLRSIPITNEAE